MSVKKAPEGPNCATNKWFFSLRLFIHMRRLLRLKAAKKEFKPAAEKPVDTEMGVAKGTEVISDHNWVLGLRKSVKMLHFGRWEEKEAAAREMRRLAAEGLNRRRAMAELGVIPPLVAMFGSDAAARRGLAVGALIELANGCFTNKALMVEAGLLSSLPNNITILQEKDKHELAKLLFSVSALAKSQFSLNLSKIIPAIVSILESSSNIETKESCLSALHNLSSILDNVADLTSTGIIDILITLSSIKETSEKALATLGNLVVTLSGKKSLERNPMVPERFIEIMTWEENPKCQELSAYILMVLAHQSSLQRQKMSEGGIVQVLLGLALLGSPLGRKRALKILQWFKDERQMRVGPHSGPQVVGRVVIGSPVSRRDAEEGKALMKRIVKQSLNKNMETITRRASGELKAFVASSSSKSLPY